MPTESDGGWHCYSFVNPATANEEPKAGHLALLDWDDIPSAIGAGIYGRGLSGLATRRRSALKAEPHEHRLRAILRCAAQQFEGWGYSAQRLSLASWLNLCLRAWSRE